MTEPIWPSIGMDCVCINDQGWYDYVTVFGVLTAKTRIAGPHFMQQLKITNIVSDEEFVNTDHYAGLAFAEFPGLYFCVCKFRPLQKIEDEETKDTTAPVDGDLVAPH